MISPRPALIMLAALLVAACSPSVTVSNATSFQVRAIVTGEDGTRNVHVVRAGGSAAGDVPEGSYAVTIVPDQAWTEAARSTRDALVRELDAPGELGPDSVDTILRELAALDERLAALSSDAAGGTRCDGSVAPDAVAHADVTVESGGTLRVTCTGKPRAR